MITVGINGASGKMGLSLVRLTTEFKDLRLVLAIDRSDNPNIGKDIGLIAGLGKAVGVRLSAEMAQKVDVMIDFSGAEGAMKILKECLKYKTALLIGTTGLNKQQIARIRQASKKIACLVSPNMSPGANLLFNLAPKIAGILGSDYDIEIIEAHHRFKKDAPSGTALRLANGITKESGRKIPIHSLRIGDIVGDHSVVFSALGERIELTHRVHTRDIFSRGALKVARFLAKAKPGFYSMADMLKKAK